MNKLSIDEMLSGKESKYSLVMAVAKRAREITCDAEERGDILSETPVILAVKDIENHKYEIFEPKTEE